MARASFAHAWLGGVGYASVMLVALLTGACDEQKAPTAMAIQADTTADAGAAADMMTGMSYGANVIATGGDAVTGTIAPDAGMSQVAMCSAPAAWTCDPCRFEDMICDCDCGADDPACQMDECKVAPDTWTCDKATYMDGYCDCNCGAWDPDCDVDATTDDCDSGTCVQPGMCELACTLSAPSLPTPGQFAAPDTSIEAGTAVVFFHNSGELTINDLRISPSANNAWGVNQLGSETILSDNYFAMRGLPCGVSMDIETRALLASGATSSPTDKLGVQFECDKRQVLILP